MRDSYDRYLWGINSLLQAIEKTDEVYLTVLALQSRLVQVLSEIRRYGPTETARADLARITSGLDRVSLAQIGEPFHNLCELHEVTEPSRIDIRHNLPQPTFVEFIGRQDEISEIGDLLKRSSGESVIVIEGEGGLGKSSLALQVAMGFLEQYSQISTEDRFGFIVWTSFRPSVLKLDSIVPRPLREQSILDIYCAIASTVARTDILNAPHAQQHNLIRNLLSEHRCLLIVDNYETINDDAVDQFLEEIPYPTKVLVTSRRRLAIGTPFRLKSMSESQAAELIVQECRRRKIVTSPDLKYELWRHTAGIPIAIVWSVARLDRYPPERVISDLTDRTGPIAQFCFDTLRSEVIGSPADAMLLSISVFPHSATREAV